ncbi:MAG: MFS transporter [Candidatus Eremiobacteraeota bacterium]|nr:MFS transporter [Candidatus Eremiobacteraeota bacterium]
MKLEEVPMKLLADAVRFLGLRRSMIGLLGMVVLVGMGERMAERFLPLYLLALGGTDIIIGLLAGLDDLLSALYSFPGGYLSDRLGTKRALAVFNVIAMVGYLVVILIPAWPAVIVGSFFFLSWSAISLPASMSLVSSVLPSKQRTMGVTMHSLVRRFPMALGPVVGGALIGIYGVEQGVRAAFIVAMLLALVALVMQQRLISEPEKPDKADAARPALRTVWREMPPALKELLISDILVRFCERIPYAFVVIWATRLIRAPVSELEFGWLTAIEMATAVLIYIPVAWLADRGRKKPFVAVTFGFFTIFPLILLFCQSWWTLVLAFMVRGLKEFGEPTRKALIMDLAPADRRAATFGAYYLARDMVVSLAAFGGGFLWLVSPRVNLLVAFGFGLLGTAWFILRGGDLGVEKGK